MTMWKREWFFLGVVPAPLMFPMKQVIDKPVDQDLSGEGVSLLPSPWYGGEK